MDSFFSPNGLPEPLTVPPAGPDEGPSWLVTFSDLVLQLFAFLLIGLVISQATPQPAPESLARPARPPETSEQAAPSEVPQPRPATALAALAVAEATVVRLAPQGTRDPVERERSVLTPAAGPAELERHEERTVPPPALASVAPETISRASGPGPDAATAAIPAVAPEQIRAAGQYLAALVAGVASGAAPEVAVHEDEVLLTLADGIGFDSGRSELSGPVESVLGELRDIVRSMPGAAIEVSGHTDDRPIRTARFPSNLELSLARAAAVAQFLSRGEADLERRIFAAGYAERRPRASNADDRGRAQNRRVEIRLIALR